MLNRDPLSKWLPKALKGTFCFLGGGGSSTPPPPVNLLNTILQAYQGQADTAGPYNQLSSIFQPAAGQTGLTDQQQQMFGYNVGPGGGIGTPATPPGGFVGAPGQGGGTAGKGGTPSGSSALQAAQIASILGGAPSNSFGGNYGPAQGPTAPTGGPVQGLGGAPFQGPVAPPGSPVGQPLPPASGASPYGPPMARSGGDATVPSASPANPTIPTYSPAQGTNIGMGNTFNNPYANVQGPGMSPGYHPGTLSLNTTALGTYGPAATSALFQANPYLADSLNMGDLNSFGASALAAGAGPSPILQALNQQAGTELQNGSPLSPQQIHDISQGSLAGFGAAGTSHGNSALLSDYLSRNSQQIQQQRLAQQFASGVQGLNTQQQQTQGGLYSEAGNIGSQFGNLATNAITNPIFQTLGLGSLNSTSSPSTALNNQLQTTNPFLNLSADVTGANFNQANAQSIAAGNQNAAQNAGIYQAIGYGIQALGSDERIKKKIKTVGKSPSGIPIKEWEYKFDSSGKRYRGAMAQDVELVNPYATVTDPFTGIKAVKYGDIDVDFELVNPYLKAA